MAQKIDRQKVYDKYSGHCAYCGCEIDIRDMQVDHVHPKWLEGSDDIANLNPSCRMCNYYKSGNDIETFRNWALGGIVKRLRDTFIFRIAEKYGLVSTNQHDVKFYFEEHGTKNR